VFTRRAIAVLAVLVAGACGGGGDTPSASTLPNSTTITTFGGIAGRAQSRACAQDASGLQQAADFYAAARGKPAPSIEALVASGFIEEAPANNHGYVLTYDGNTGKVSAAGACTYP
jgi:hypothetical protein